MAKSVGLLAVCAALFALAANCLAQSAAELLEQGKQAMDAGNFRAAEQTYTRLLQQQPSAANLDYLATAEASAGDLEPAVHHWKRAIAGGDHSAQTYFHLGLALLQSGHNAEGITALRQAITREPQLVEAHYALAIALLDAGQPADGLAQLRIVEGGKTKDPAMWVNLARAWFMLQKTKLALDKVDQAYQAFPDQPQVAVTLAELCLGYGQAQKARYLLESASEAMPGEPRIKIMLARASLEAREPVETLAALQDIPDASGDAGEVPFLRASAYGLVKKSEEAEREYGKAIAADPANADYRIGRATYYERQRLFEQALADLKVGAAIDPGIPTAPYAMAVILAVTGKTHDSVGLCEEVEELFPTYAPAYFLAGMIRQEEGDNATALLDLTKATGFDPENALFARELGSSLIRQGQVAKSRHYLDRAIKIDAKDPISRYWRALAFAKSAEPRAAIVDLRVAIALDPKFALAYQEKAVIERALGDDHAAAATTAVLHSLPAQDERDLWGLHGALVLMSPGDGREATSHGTPSQLTETVN